MLTTFELDDDLAPLLDAEARQSGEPLSQTMNRVLRLHLPQSAPPTALPPFKVMGAKDLGLPVEWTSHKVEDLLDLLEGSDRHW